MLYQLYGLVIETTEFLPALIPSGDNSTSDIFFRVYLQPAPSVSVKGKVPLLKPAAGSCYELAFHDTGYDFIFIKETACVFFRVNMAGTEVSLYLADESLRYSALALFVTTVMHFLACLHQRYCLHANVIQINNKVIAIVGESGAGKSTLATALCISGAEFLADDVAALSLLGRQICVYSGVPHLKVDRQTLNNLNIANLTNFPVFDDFYSNQLPNGKIYIKNPTLAKPVASTKVGLPLTAIYILQPRNKAIDTANIKRITASAVLPLLVRHTKGREIFGNTDRTKVFQFLAEIARTVPVKTLECPDTLKSLASVCSSIVSDVESFNELIV